jgi:hypothetical protein
MPTDDTRTVTPDGVDVRLDSDPELTLDMSEELLDRARQISRDVRERVRRALGMPDDAPDPPRV